jgi:hypothetical protein
MFLNSFFLFPITRKEKNLFHTCEKKKETRKKFHEKHKTFSSFKWKIIRMKKSSNISSTWAFQVGNFPLVNFWCGLGFFFHFRNRNAIEKLVWERIKVWKKTFNFLFGFWGLKMKFWWNNTYCKKLSNSRT